MPNPSTPLGQTMLSLYAEFLVLYGDSDRAAVATARLIDELLAGSRRRVLRYEAA